MSTSWGRRTKEIGLLLAEKQNSVLYKNHGGRNYHGSKVLPCLLLEVTQKSEQQSLEKMQKEPSILEKALHHPPGTG